MLVAAGGRHDRLCDRSADDLRCREPEHALGCPVELEDGAVHVDRDHGVERGVEDRALAALALLESVPRKVERIGGWWAVGVHVPASMGCPGRDGHRRFRAGTCTRGGYLGVRRAATLVGYAARRRSASATASRSCEIENGFRR